MVGTASKGPVNIETLITDEGTLISIFGEPSSSHLALYAAKAYLNKGSQLKFVRVANYDSAASGVVLDTVGGSTALTVSAVSTGSWGNAITLVVSAGADVGTYKISVKYNGSVVEVFDRVKVGAANVDDANYVETRINGISDYISVVADESITTLYVTTTAVALVGGDDGAAVSDADVIGTAGAPPTIPATGLQLFANKEAVTVNLIAVPGNSHAAVISAMVTLCETREDCICLIDPPMGLTVPEVVAWTNGTGGGLYDPDAAINSIYAAVYYPWLQVFDGYSNANVWVPPSGHVAGIMAYTDEVSDPWFAPMGFNRGRLTDVLAVEHSPTQGERDYMYSNGNIVNPIVNFTGKGIVVWGQRTTTRTSSKLDRIAVVRLVCYLRTGVAAATLDIVGEPNDETTWSLFINMVDPILEAVQARRGLDYKNIVCDETTNTEAVRARKEFYAKIFILPTDASEIINIAFNVINSQAQITLI